jgi:hypothetical protein
MGYTYYKRKRKDVGIKFKKKIQYWHKRKGRRLLSVCFLKLKGLRWQVLLKQRKWLEIVSTVMLKPRKIKEFVVPKEGKAKESSFRRKGKEGDCWRKWKAKESIFAEGKEKIKKMVVLKGRTG